MDIKEASELIERIGYGEVSYRQKTEIFSVVFAAFLREQVHLLHPFTAFLDCFVAEAGGLWESSAWYSKLLLGGVLWYLHRMCKKAGDRPGVNDGLIGRWFWTHDPKSLAELLERSKRLDQVGYSARSMLRSLAERHPLIAAALEADRTA